MCLTSSAASSERAGQQSGPPLPVRSPGSGPFCQQPAGPSAEPLVPRCSAALVGPERSLQPLQSQSTGSAACSLPCRKTVKGKAEAAPRVGSAPREVRRGALGGAPGPGPDRAGGVRKGAEQEPPAPETVITRVRASPLREGHGVSSVPPPFLQTSQLRPVCPQAAGAVTQL